MSGLEALILPIFAGIGEAATAAGAAASSLAPYAGLAGTAATVGGTLLQGAAASEQAKVEAENSKRIASYKNAQLERAAAEERGASLREAQDVRRKGEQLQRRQIALASASGGGTRNPTILDILSDTAEETAYQAGAAKFKGESRARGLLDEGTMGVAQAKADASTLRAKAKNTMTASILEGFGEGAEGIYRYQKDRRDRDRGYG